MSTSGGRSFFLVLLSMGQRKNENGNIVYNRIARWAFADKIFVIY